MEENNNQPFFLGEEAAYLKSILCYASLPLRLSDLPEFTQVENVSRSEINREILENFDCDTMNHKELDELLNKRISQLRQKVAETDSSVYMERRNVWENQEHIAAKILRTHLKVMLKIFWAVPRYFEPSTEKLDTCIEHINQCGAIFNGLMLKLREPYCSLSILQMLLLDARLVRHCQMWWKQHYASLTGQVFSLKRQREEGVELVEVEEKNKLLPFYMTQNLKPILKVDADGKETSEWLIKDEFLLNILALPRCLFFDHILRFSGVNIWVQGTEDFSSGSAVATKKKLNFWNYKLSDNPRMKFLVDLNMECTALRLCRCFIDRDLNYLKDRKISPLDLKNPSARWFRDSTFYIDIALSSCIALVLYLELKFIRTPTMKKSVSVNIDAKIKFSEAAGGPVLVTSLTDFAMKDFRKANPKLNSDHLGKISPACVWEVNKISNMFGLELQKAVDSFHNMFENLKLYFQQMEILSKAITFLANFVDNFKNFNTDNRDIREDRFYIRLIENIKSDYKKFIHYKKIAHIHFKEIEGYDLAVSFRLQEVRFLNKDDILEYTNILDEIVKDTEKEKNNNSVVSDSNAVTPEL